MKKSSIILIVTLAVCAIAAFVLPPLTGEQRNSKVEKVYVQCQGKMQKIAVEQFDSVHIDTQNLINNRYDNTPIVAIMESDSTQTPYILADAGWAQYIHYEATDNECSISVIPPFTEYVSEDSDETNLEYYFKDSDALCLTLVVPKSYVHRLKPLRFSVGEAIVEMKDFNDASVEMDISNPVKATNCSFKSFQIE